MKSLHSLGHLISVIGSRGLGIAPCALVCGVAALGACSSETTVPAQGNPPVVVAEKTPPTLSGGTLLVTTHTKNRAVVSDPDRDLIWVVDLAAGTPVASITLNDNDEPGRLVEDAAGLVHVALRKGGAIVTVDPQAGTLVKGSRGRVDVCAAPRGVTYDPAKDVIHVACRNGELVTLGASASAPSRTLRLDRDLRDVIVDGEDLAVTTFRTAELLVVGADGAIKSRQAPPAINTNKIRERGRFQSFTPNVAWRTIGLPDGSVGMIHQRALDSTVVIQANTGSYGGGGGSEPGCDPTIAHTTISRMRPGLADATVASPAIPKAILPIDLAAHTTTDGRLEFAFVAAASNKVFHVDAALVNTSPGGNETDPGCLPDSGDSGDSSGGSSSTPIAGEPIAVAFWNDLTVVQTRDPITVSVLGNGTAPIVLPGESTSDTGHDMFHRNDGGSVDITCASCHPEGTDDSHVWRFDTGPRRTQNIAGDVLSTAPFHWDGDMKDIGMIMHEVFEKRMGGQPQGPEHVAAFQTFISKLPPIANPITGNPDSIARGDTLFHGDALCSTCHAGERFTNNENKDVGTGRAFQVPSLLGVSMRSPFMHDGCAKTLHDRFDTTSKCGGNSSGPNAHGNTANLTPGQVDDLVAYLETL